MPTPSRRLDEEQFDFETVGVQYTNNYLVPHGRAPHAPAEAETQLLMRAGFNLGGLEPCSDEAIVRHGIVRHGKLGFRANDVLEGLEGKAHPRRSHDQTPLLNL